MKRKLDETSESKDGTNGLIKAVVTENNGEIS